MGNVHQGNPPEAAALAVAQHSSSESARHPSSLDIERILRANCAPSASSWHSVGDGLPDEKLLVLVALNDDDVWPGYRDGDIWRYVDAMPITVERVTHWVHFPLHPYAA
jgi:hypothetical protein